MDENTVVKLRKGAEIDYRDVFGRFLRAKIMQIVEDPDDILDKKHGIHYSGWRNFWNHWSYPRYQYQRYAEHGSISMRKLHRNCMEYIKLNKPYGNFIEIKPIHLFEYNMFKMEHDGDDTIDVNYCNQYLKWHVGEVVDCDPYSAQVKCKLFQYCKQTNTLLKPNGKDTVYWVHLDNDEECAPKKTNILHYFV